jgi:hypothetical protein
MIDLSKLAPDGAFNVAELESILSEQTGKEVKVIGYKPKDGEYREFTEKDKHG